MSDASDPGAEGTSIPVHGHIDSSQRLIKSIPDVHDATFGHLLSPERPEELMALLNLLVALNIGAWRGHANADWKIDSSLARRCRDQRAWFGPSYSLTESSLRGVEKALLERTRSVGYGEGLGELELLARLQHHGAATRLLDCTRSAFVALWFACQEEFDEPGLLIGFRLAEHAIQLDTAMLERDVEELLAIDDDKPLWWQPRDLSPRISAQQAVFVFGPVVEEPWGSIRLGAGHIDIEDTGNVPGAAIIHVSVRLKQALNSIWDELFGFTRETLFPDFDGYASAHGVKEAFPPGFPLGVSMAS